MASSGDSKTCAICLGRMESGQGQTIFTAECTHSFHFSCISNNVTYGNYVCPVCRAKWNDIPFTVPSYNPNVNENFSPNPANQVPQLRVPVRSSSISEREPILFSDDEPLPLVTFEAASSASPVDLQNVSVKAIPERAAIASSESVPEFAVLVGIRAPSLSADVHQFQRAPIDLVTVLDVSGSMHGSKLALLKRAVDFVIDNLGPSDRLSIVSFSTRARRILPLRRMTELGRQNAKRSVNSLSASGSTNIVEALKKGVQVLEERRHQNPVSSIIFLSDGRDTCYHGTRFQTFSSPRQPPQYLHLLPAFICPENRRTEDQSQQQTFPVHAFGFGTDHDPLTMHAISDASGGTFSFIESYEMVQDAFASCIGGLLSVVIQELRLMVRSASHGVEIKSISSGRYASEITNERSQGLINVGDLYADEEKEFLIDLAVPVCQSIEDDSNTTSLLDITCSYRAVMSKDMIQIDGELVTIRRPKYTSPFETTISLEVDRQRNRLSAAQGITEAQEMAETGNLMGARALLSNRRSTLLASASGQAGDGLCLWLESEMKEMDGRMASMRLYESTGRAYALSNMSSHAYQRATTRGSSVPGAVEWGSFTSFGAGGATHRSIFNAYATPNMANMVVKKAQTMKKRKTIDSFFKSKEHTSISQEHSPSNIDISNPIDQQSNKSPTTDVDVSSLEPDPALRTPIWKYNVNQRDEIRRAYIKMGPYQPIKNEYPPTKFGSQNRRFQSHWFKKFTWLEYSPSKDAAFCFPCFLFEHEHPRNPTFTTNGFKYWKRVNDGDRCAFFMHIGCNTSPHNNAVEYLDNLMNIPRHIDKVMSSQSSEEKQKNRLRLAATIESIRWLTLQACAFRGHDESPSSNNRGNFIEMIKFMGRMNENIGEVVLEKAPKNAKYTSPDIQKDVLNIISNQVRTKIRKEIGDAKFCILVDEARDASNKEQLAIVLRFVDIDGFLRERFFAIVHVTDTTAATLKKEISDALGRYALHIHNMRGQGYDGASNMRGSWNGLQALFLKDCPCAYYVHCFAHRLQLALTAAAEKEVSIWLFFSKLNSICNLINASPKRHAELHSAQRIEVAHMIVTGERETGRGCNQIGNLLRPGKTRWSSNFDSICSIIDMYSSVITVLENMVEDGASNSIRGEASGLLVVMNSFDFIFILHLMHKIMGITNLLCRALQEKSLDILNAMDYVSTTKSLLSTLREMGFSHLLGYVKEVCAKYDIEIPHMEARYKSATSRSCQQNDSITVGHHYQFDVFTAAIDFQLEELNNRFKDDAVELLKLSCALEPKENFKFLNVDHIYLLAEKFYFLDFDAQDLHHLRIQLDHYKLDVIGHERFQNLSTISELCQVLVETNKSGTYNMIDRLIRLVLTLPVSTATTERAFSAMKLVKTALRNKMEEEFFADSMVIYIERDLVENLDNDLIINEFDSKKNRRAQLQ